MKIPFTTEQFLGVFKNYNESVFPAQAVLFILALFILIMAFKKNTVKRNLPAVLTGLLWFWMGMVYHIIYFSPINKAAYIFGILFVLQGIFFIYEGAVKKNLTFEFRKNFYTVTGLIIILYSLVIYPVLGHYLGHVYPAAPTFGLPCPTVIFTFGIILFSISKVRLYLLIIPFIWSVIGVSAALQLGITEDLGLLASGILTVIISVYHNSKIKKFRII